MKSIYLKSILILISLSTYSHVIAKEKDYLKFKVIENTSTSECAYLGTVSIKARYKRRHFNSDSSILTVESSFDGIEYSTVYSQEVEKGRGRLTMTFDVGECSKDLRVTLSDQ